MVTKEERMPLKRGSSQKVISENISELSRSQTVAGKKRTHAQNVAIALQEAQKSRGGDPKKNKEGNNSPGRRGDNERRTIAKNKANSNSITRKGNVISGVWR